MAQHAVPDVETQRVADLAVSLIRTWTPIGVGSVIAWLAVNQHVVIPAHASAAVGVAAAGIAASGYYGLARVLEHGHWTAALGRWMLGGIWRGTPTYVTDR
jgi:hypothetical protein